MDVILRTRIKPPKLSNKFFRRSTLINSLSENSHKKFILLIAAAGYGKTNLIQDFLTVREKQYAWIHLHQDMDNFYTFMKYLIYSFQTINTEYGTAALSLLNSYIESPSNTAKIKSTIPDIVSTLINELDSSIKTETFIVFDDLWLINDTEWLKQFLEIFLSNLPANLHVVIASRQFPPVNRTELTAKREIFILREDDLRFDKEEIEQLLEKMYDIKSTPELLRVLDEKIGGWITGVHLVLQSFTEKLDELKEIDYHRDIFDYFANEIFERLEPEVQRFLLKVSLLDEFDEEICTNLFPKLNCKEIIRNLINKNIFIQQNRNDVSEKDSYSFQSLFLDFLQHKQKVILSNEEREYLCVRLCEYFLEKRDTVNAVRYGIESGRHNLVLPLIQDVFGLLLENSEYPLLWKWLVLLESEVDKQKNGTMFFIKARLLQFYRGDVNSALKIIDKAISCFNENNDKEGVIKSQILKARMLLDIGKIKEAVTLLNEIKETPASAENRATIFYTLAFANFVNTSYDSSLTHLEKALEVCHTNEITDITIDIYRLFGHIFLIRGDFLKSAVYYEKVAGSDKSIIDNFEIYCNLSLLSAQCTKFDKALESLSSAEKIFNKLSIPKIQIAYYLASQAVSFEFGDYESAIVTIQKACDIAEKINHKYYKYLTYRLMADTYYNQNMLLKADEYYDMAFSYIDEESKLDLMEYAVMKALLIKKHGPDESVESILKEALEYYQEQKFVFNHLQVQFYLADYYFELDSFESAKECLMQSLEASQQKGCYSFLLRELLDSREIFDFALSNNICFDFVNALFAFAIDKKNALWISSEAHERISKAVDALYDIQVFTFGNPKIVVKGNTVPENFWAKKKWKTIFIYLFTLPRKQITKERLIDIFYPETAAGSIDNIFHQIISKFRGLSKLNKGTLGEKLTDEFVQDKPRKQKASKSANVSAEPLNTHMIIYEDKVLQINPLCNLKVDFEEFEKLCSLSRQAKNKEDKINYSKSAVEIYKGEFLEGNYDGWCEDLRDKFKNEFMDVSESLILLQFESEFFNEVIFYSNNLLIHDKLNETAYEYLFRSYLGLGKTSETKEIIRQMIKQFQKELETDPPRELIQKLELLVN